MATFPTPHLAPAPASLAAALADVGLIAQLAVQRADGQPIEARDLAALAAVVTCADLEAGRAVSDAEAASIASHAFPTALARTGTGGE